MAKPAKSRVPTAAKAMKAGMEILRPLLVETGAPQIGTLVIGTVKGDIHDIGKNLVAMMMEGAGFNVINLGINTDVDAFLEAVREHNPDILGMSAMLTTTMTYMPVVIEALEEQWDGLESRCLVVPNFAIGAVLMMRFAELAMPHFESAEIIEMHHHDKPDAPSGTALNTAARMAAARRARQHARGRELVKGALGADVEGVPVHSLRSHGSLAHQEVVFGTGGQLLTLRHDTTDYACFVPGILLALRSIKSLRPGVTVGLEHLLGI